MNLVDEGKSDNNNDNTLFELAYKEIEQHNNRQVIFLKLLLLITFIRSTNSSVYNKIVLYTFSLYLSCFYKEEDDDDDDDDVED